MPRLCPPSCHSHRLSDPARCYNEKILCNHKTGQSKLKSDCIKMRKSFKLIDTRFAGKISNMLTVPGARATGSVRRRAGWAGSGAPLTRRTAATPTPNSISRARARRSLARKQTRVGSASEAETPTPAVRTTRSPRRERGRASRTKPGPPTPPFPFLQATAPAPAPPPRTTHSSPHRPSIKLHPSSGVLTRQWRGQRCRSPPTRWTHSPSHFPSPSPPCPPTCSSCRQRRSQAGRCSGLGAARDQILVSSRHAKCKIF